MNWAPLVIPTKADEGPRGVRRTPLAVYRELERRYSRGGFTLDAAASQDNALAPLYHDERADGLTRAWVGRVFCNPPYSEIEQWVRRAHHQFAAGNAEVIVMLLPARTSTEWFAWAGERGARFVFPRYRIRFLDADGVELARPFEHSVVLIFETGLDFGRRAVAP